MKKFSLVLCVCFLVCLAQTSANTLTITGTVFNAATKRPLGGVTVSAVPPPNVRMKMISTKTDASGRFSIKLPSIIRSLQFELKGYVNITTAIGDKKNLTIKMNANTSVTITEAKELEDLQAKVTNQALQGKLAEVRVRGKGEKVVLNFSPPYVNAIRSLPNQENYNTESYSAITENRFLAARQNPLSTFGIDVDAASYSNIRRYINNGNLPPVDAVRIEEMLNYFSYSYPQPKDDDPFSINTEIGNAPWNAKHKLLKIGLQGKKVAVDKLPASNLVFLIDVSGSMNQANKLPLLKSSMKLLVDQLREQDRVSIVVYAGAAGLVLPATDGGKKQTIKTAIDGLEAGGSTAGGEGIKLAYKVASEHFIKKGNNRVILATDGDFNVGTSSDAEMQRLIEEKRETGVFLTVLGYGMGNYKDSKMETLADKGNGNYAYIDNLTEARKVLVSEFGGTLFTIAKDVKLQLEFNPAKVQSYRLIGYENRLLNKEDFNNDKKDAGDLGSGHTVTALYEIIPAGIKSSFADSVDALKYQKDLNMPAYAAGNELLTIKLRYKKPDSNTSQLIEKAIADASSKNTSTDFQFAAAVAGFGMMLRHSDFSQDTSFEKIISWTKSSLGNDEEGYRNEFLQLVKSSALLYKEKLTTKADIE